MTALGPKVGIMLPSYDLGGRTLRLEEIARYALEAEECGFDSVWTSDHFHGDELAPGGASGRYDAIVGLALLAARTRSITLGSLVLANGFRPVAQLAREVASLSQLAPGRLIIGLGSGGRAREYETFGFPRDHPATRMRETLTVLPALLSGEIVSFAGEFVGLDGASLLLDEPVPPLWVAAFAPRMRALAVELSDGWNTAWHGPDDLRFRDELALVRAAQAGTPGAVGDLTISVGLRLIPVSGRERSALAARLERLRPDPVPRFWEVPLANSVATGTPEELAEVVRRYHDAGADHVILNLSQLPTMLLDPAYLPRAAELLAYLR